MWIVQSPCLRRILLVIILFVPRSSVSDNQNIEHRRSKRVIGGSGITNGQWPWLVNIRAYIPTSSVWIVGVTYTSIYCGASLIDSQWIMSAAHCFTVPGAPAGISTPSNWYVRAGSVDRLDQQKSFWNLNLDGDQNLNLWTVTGSKIFVHPNYTGSGNSWADDIVLMKLSKPLPLKPADPYIDKVALPKTVRDYWPPPGINCYMQGWGCTSLNGPLQQYAQSVMLPIIDRRMCKFAKIGRYRICAGADYHNSGICKGDSGGPLVCLHNNTWTVAGIASYTSAIAPQDTPGVFTRVSKYTNWITSVLTNN